MKPAAPAKVATASQTTGAEAEAEPAPLPRNKDGHIPGEQLTFEQIRALKRKEKPAQPTQPPV